MFIFRPGSGFTGPAVRVEPGFEMEKYSQEDLFDSSVLSGEGNMENSQNVVASTYSSRNIAGSTQGKRYLFVTNK